MASKLYTVGLTGSTGAGKSEVARVMASRSWAVIDADQISRDVVEVGTPTLAALVERFSADILREDGSLDRKKLASIAFASSEQTDALNAIVHPAVMREIRAQQRRAAREGCTLAVIDAPLLLQAGVDLLCQCTVAVVSTPQLRLQRICERDGLTEEQAKQRMSTQPSDDEYADRVDYVLFNLGDREALHKAAVTLCEQIERAAV